MISLLIPLWLLPSMVYSSLDGTYYIINRLSGKALDCTTNPISIKPSFVTTSQMFQLTKRDVQSGYDRYEVKCVSSGYCWDYRGSDKKIGRQGCSTTNGDQKYIFFYGTTFPSTYRIRGPYGKYLEVSGTADGSQLTCDSSLEISNRAQWFTLEKVCPPLNTDASNPGRCGPSFGSVRCNRNLVSYAVYCNSANGWCGTTNAHRDAQSDDKYDYQTTACTAIGSVGSLPRSSPTNRDWFVISVNKDTFTMVLLLSNALLIIGCICCGLWMKCSNDKGYKYNKVNAYSGTETET